MSTITQHKAADLVQEAAKGGDIAFYVESLPNGDFRIILADGDMSSMAEIAYAAADRIAEQASRPGHAIRLRD